jgi:hypothetical protein
MIRRFMIAASLAISACAPVEGERPMTPVALAPAARTVSPPAGPRRAPITMILQPIEGAEAARMRAVFAPVERRLAACHPGGGVVRLRLVSRGANARYSIEADTTLDGHARRCVLETLSAVEIQGISDASPSARPSGFSALLRIEW